MSFGRSDPIRSLILHGSPSGFSRPAEGWFACSNDDILVAAAKQLGVLQQRREYRDDVGNARANWQQHRANLAEVYVWLDASMHKRARTQLVLVAEAMQLDAADVAGQAAAQKVSARWCSDKCSGSRHDHSFAQLAAGLRRPGQGVLLYPYCCG